MAYRAPAWLPGGHLQTLYSSVCIRIPPVAWRRERLELPDGDFLDFDWVDGRAGAPVVVCSMAWKAAPTAIMRAAS